MEIDRRLFLLTAAAAPLYAGPLVLLSEADAKLIEAICDCIIPADDAPGATQAGVVFYIDKQLAGPLKRFQATYQRALPVFRSKCRELTGKEFPDLSSDARTAFLKEIEVRGTPELASLFSLVIDHAMQGFYGSPEHGGNRGEASWRMLQIADVMEGHRH